MPSESDSRKLSNVQNNVIHWCRYLREQAGVSKSDVARLLDQPLASARNTVGKFEAGRWPDNADELIDIYAAAAGLENARHIWRLAIANDAWSRPEPGSPKALAQAEAASLRHRTTPLVSG